MQSLSICYKCRVSVFGTRAEQWAHSLGATAIFKRHRSHAPLKRHRSEPQPRNLLGDFPTRRLDPEALFFATSLSSDRFRGWKRAPSKPTTAADQPTRIPVDSIIPFFEEDVSRWAEHRAVGPRLRSFGIPEDEIQPLLRAFVGAVQGGHLSTPKAFEKYRLIRFNQDLSEDRYYNSLDIIYSTVLFAWASSLASITSLVGVISTQTFEHIRNLTGAASRSHPQDEYPEARSMHRKIIMHVGPTNSGKTHNALRALAAAKTGVYAGPLRLLAHEIWERLNLGQIIPAGVDVNEAKISPADLEEKDSALDVGEKAPAVRKLGDPKYARTCNMITGEEQKIVDPNSGLTSCTVEMVSYSHLYDVAVIDEIQMIGSPDRGNGWTSAVLGLRAKELHLCGEESAIPLVEALLKDTGDELIINRYQRLTPLRVEEESLDGDLTHVREGDCIVAFNKPTIFALKRKIEEQTSLRCAVVYGRLPPEIRSEQAALFNDPDSGYDVIIGSDAIGMGLNLKIKRIIFETVRKFDGDRERFLSVSQTKQIAGRAGRYGLHGNDSGGTTTTMNKSDLSFLRKTLDVNIPPLSFARIGPTNDTFKKLANVLPPDCPTMAIFDAHTYISMLPPIYRYTSMTSQEFLPRCNFVDSCGAGMTIEERLLFTLVPISWRDDLALEITSTILRMHGEEMYVDLMELLETTSVMETLERVEKKMNPYSKGKATVDELSSMESFHKVLVMYVWMTFRQPLVYHQYAEAADLKERVEKALDWALQSLTRDGGLGTGLRRETPVKWLNKRKTVRTSMATTAEENRNLLRQMLEA